MLTIVALHRQLTEQLNRADLCYGHGTCHSDDEAWRMIAHVLQWSIEADRELEELVTEQELQAVQALAAKRIQTRQPLPYLTHRADFAGLTFYVDERVLIPRSPIAELIEDAFQPWRGRQPWCRALELCTGSGCIAIAMAHHMPGLKVDAVDLSPDALAVASQNVTAHQMNHRVHLIQSDLFQAVPIHLYDVVVSNPPYVPLDEMNALPPEFRHEPSMALAAGIDGLDIIDRILREAPRYLHECGVLVLEVGHLFDKVAARYPQLEFTWLEFERGGEGVALIEKSDLDRLDEVMDDN